MKIQKVRIQNLKSLKHVEEELDGNSVFLIGKNGVGKTSFIQAVFSLLANEKLPPNPVTSGEEKGFIEAIVDGPDGDMKISLNFSNSNPKGTLTIRTIDGKVSSPKTFIADMMGNISFDIFEFLKKTDKKKLEFIKELVGLNTDKVDSEIKETFEERTITNRQIKNLDGFINEMDIDSDKADIYSKEKDIELIQNDINELVQSNVKYDSIKSALDRISSHEHLISLNSRIDTYKLSVNNAKINLKDAENRLLEAKENLTLQERRIKENEENIEKGKVALSECERQDVSELETKKKRAIDFNLIVRNYETYRNKLSEMVELENLSKDLSKILNGMNYHKKTLIEACEMPVDGLSIQDDIITWNGLPLDDSQINTAKLMEIGIKVMIASNKDLKVCRVPQGSLLDKDSLDSLMEFVEKNDYQAFVEIVDSESDDLRIEMIEV